MSVAKIVIHTDVFLQHLSGAESPSVLRQAMSKFFCYTTVYQAIELFSLAKTDEEAGAIEHSMAAMKILGVNPKNARMYGGLLASGKRVAPWNILIGGLCIESRLPILTDRRRDFAGMSGLVIVPTSYMRRFESGADILKAVRQQGKAH